MFVVLAEPLVFVVEFVVFVFCVSVPNGQKRIMTIINKTTKSTKSIAILRFLANHDVIELEFELL